jgi:hypothetical protein
MLRSADNPALLDLRFGELRRVSRLQSVMVAVAPVWWLRELSARLPLEPGESRLLLVNGSAVPVEVQP